MAVDPNVAGQVSDDQIKNLYIVANDIGTKFLGLEAKPSATFPQHCWDQLGAIRECSTYVSGHTGPPPAQGQNYTVQELQINGNNVPLKSSDQGNPAVMLFYEQNTLYVYPCTPQGQIVQGWGKDTYPGDAYDIATWCKNLDNLAAKYENWNNNGDIDYYIGKASSKFGPLFGIIGITSEVIRDYCQVTNILSLYGAYKNGVDLKGRCVTGAQQGLLCMSQGGTWDQKNYPKNAGNGATQEAKKSLCESMITLKIIQALDIPNKKNMSADEQKKLSKLISDNILKLYKNLE